MGFYSCIVARNKNEITGIKKNPSSGPYNTAVSIMTIHTVEGLRKWPAPETDTFFMSQGCPLTRSSTVIHGATSVPKQRCHMNKAGAELAGLLFFCFVSSAPWFSWKAVIDKLTHLSNGPGSVGIHSWVGTPCKRKLSRNLLFFMLSVSSGVNRLNVNALKGS